MNASQQVHEGDEEQITTVEGGSHLWEQLQSRMHFSRNLAVYLILASIISAITTYVVMTRSESPFGPNPEVVIGLALTNFILLMALVAVVAGRAFSLWVALRQGSVGSRLQTRVVIIFSLITIVPTVTVSVFAALFLNASIEAWFSDKINTGLEESVAVAEAYLEEHKDIIKADARAMAAAADMALYEGIANNSAFSEMINEQASRRSLTEAAVIQRGQILARTNLTFSLVFDTLPPQVFEIASGGQMVVHADEDKIRAIVKLQSIPDAFLVVGRFVDSRVVNHVKNAQSAVKEYRSVKARLSDIQIQFSLLFVMVSLLLLLAAIWYGMYFAARLVVPISHLVEAAERVRAGDYATRVAEGPEDDELATLGRAFNRMTNQLASQRRDLVKANRQLDSRRRFSEAVITGVSAGVIALDTNRKITLHSRSAQKLLQMEADEQAIGESISEILPEIEPILDEVASGKAQSEQTDLTITREGKPLTLHVRIAAQEFDGELEGFIVTFDDITPLVNAQRHAAWSDVARRVAHEIKNPLTPIQLSAQRLKRKYVEQLDEAEREGFSRYTDTIIRHVGDIGRMVEEFVGFARMPAPSFTKENMNDLLTKTVFSEETTHSDIRYILDLSEDEIFAVVDASQVRQVITNLVKNAAEAIDAVISAPDDENNQKVKAREEGGEITVSCKADGEHCIIEVRDNGTGFPPDQIHRLLEPYVTTRAKGTGLGLAIVKKIAEDHKGRVELENQSDQGGALVRLILPLAKD